MKQVLIYSIRPEHVLNFLNGKKTEEIRRRDLPQWAKDKLARGEVVQGYGYCTKGKPYLINHPYHSYMLIDDKTFDNLNGLVVVKFRVSGVEKIRPSWYPSFKPVYEITADTLWLMKLSNEELNNYGNGSDLYAHHFTNIQPIEPMGLSNFYKQVPFFEIRDKEKYLFEFGKYAVRDKEKIDEERKLTKAPQSFQSAWVKGE